MGTYVHRNYCLTNFQIPTVNSPFGTNNSKIKDFLQIQKETLDVYNICLFSLSNLEIRQGMFSIKKIPGVWYFIFNEGFNFFS